MICPNCQTDNRPNARFCDGCGYELPSVEPLPYAPTTALPPDDPFDGDDDEILEHVSDIGARPTMEFTRTSALTVPTDGPYGAPMDEAAVASASQALTAPLSGGGAAATGPIPDIAGAIPGRAWRAYDPGFPAKPPRKPLSKKRVGAIIAVLAILAALAALITLGAQMLGGKSVPDVTGLAQVDATYTVQEAGFHVSVEEVVSDEVEGIVLSTDPPAGTRLAEGATVTLRISRARVIPDVIGLPLEEAENILSVDGFTNIEVTRAKSNEPADTVLSITPEALTRSRADALITVEVAEPFRVPEVAGQTQDEATAALQAEGYSVSVQRMNTEDAPEGTAMKTDPVAGSVLASGSSVTLYVAHNRSVELVELTRAFFADTPTITMNGQPYEMSKVGDVSYSGGSTCAFTITVRPIQTVTWFGTQTETRYGNYQTVQGAMTWTDDNNVATVEPSIKQGS